MKTRLWIGLTLCLGAIAAALPTPAAADTLPLHDGGGARGPTFLRFELESTKAGFIKTTVEGFVRDFEVVYDWTERGAKHARVSFAAADMRTHNSSRDRKMWSHCLDSKRYPRVEVELNADVPLGAEVQVPGRIHIRGAWHPLWLTAHLVRSGDTVTLDGKATVRLSELGIPDPSIWIAKVNDAVELAFRVSTHEPDAPQPAS